MSGAGEIVEPVQRAALVLLLVPAEGLSAADAYAELDRLARWRDRFDAERLRQLAAAAAPELAQGLENDLEPAVLSLRPALRATLEQLRDAGALAARISGSGPSAFGLFEDEAAAARAAERVPGSLVVRTREPA